MLHPIFDRQWLKRALAALVAVEFLAQSAVPVGAQMSVVPLPAPGTLVLSSQASYPMVLKGVTIHPDNPLQLDFVLDTGDSGLSGEDAQKQAQRLVDYFMASLTVPSGDLWVNLSPIEHDRIVPDALGQTELGRDMLAQDYILKQLTASLMHPEQELGKMFWNRLAEEAYKRYGITDLPENPFHKVWIMPDRARVFEQGTSVFVIDGHLKVMLEEDYVMGEDSRLSSSVETGLKPVSTKTSQDNAGEKDVLKDLIRDIILPEIEKEVNTGANFSALRQIYNSLILAKWYKNKIKDSDLSALYVDQNKVDGVNLKDTKYKEQIYQQYVKAYQVGVFDFIKDDYDPATSQMVSRKYFSGGIQDAPVELDYASLVEARKSFRGESYKFQMGMSDAAPVAKRESTDHAMLEGYDGNLEEQAVLISKETRLQKVEESKNAELFQDMKSVREHLNLPSQDYDIFLAPVESAFGAAIIQYKGKDVVVITKDFYKKMKANPNNLRQRVFVNIFTVGNRLAKVKAEYIFARDVLHNTDNLLVKGSFDDIIARVKSQIMVLNPVDSENSLENKIKKMGYRKFKVKRPVKDELAYGASEALANSAEESIYRIAINALNGDVNLKSRIRLHENAADVQETDKINVGFFAYSGHPTTLAHFITNMLQGMAEAKVDTMVVSVTKGDHRKTDLKATFDIRNQMAINFIHEVTADLVRVMTLPRNVDEGLNGEEKIENFVELNKEAGEIRVVYIAGGDHNLVFARTKHGDVSFKGITTGSKGNLKDFLYYVKRGGKHYQDLLRRLIADPTKSQENFTDQKQIDIIRSLVEADDPVALVTAGQELPELDVIGKLLLLEKYFGEMFQTKSGGKKVSLVFLKTERPGDSKKESLREEIDFPTINNPGLKADISSTNLRFALLAMILKDDIDLRKLYATPEEIFLALLKQKPAVREYLFSLIRFKSKFALSKDIERFFPLDSKKMREFEAGLKARFKSDLEEKLGLKGAEIKMMEGRKYIDLDKQSEGAPLGFMVIVDEKGREIFKLRYYVVNGMDDNAKAKNQVKILGYYIDKKYPGVLAYAHQFLADLNQDSSNYLQEHKNGNGEFNAAMLKENDLDQVQEAIAAPGGIDMNTIDIDSEGRGAEIEFDPAMLSSLRETGVSGFIPVISNFRAVSLAEILK